MTLASLVAPDPLRKDGRVKLHTKSLGIWAAPKDSGKNGHKTQSYLGLKL